MTEFHDSSGFLGSIKQEMQDSSHVSLVDETSDRMYSDRLDNEDDDAIPRMSDSRSRSKSRRQTKSKLGRRSSTGRTSPRNRSPMTNRSYQHTSSSTRRGASPIRSDTGGGSRRSSKKSSRSFVSGPQYNPQDARDTEVIEFEPQDVNDLDDAQGKRISYTTRAPGGRNLWDQHGGAVDQGANLMDVESGRYDRSAMAGFRSKSLVDIFLENESTRGNYGVVDLSAPRRKHRARNCFLLLVVVALSIVFVTTVPNFGLVAKMNQDDDDNNNNDGGAPEPEELIEEEVEVTKRPKPGNTEDVTVAEIYADDELDQEFTIEVTEEDEEEEPKGEITTVEVFADDDVLDIEDVPQDKKLDALKFYLVDLDITEEEQLDIMGSPVKKAMHWIAEKDPAKLPIPGFSEVETNNLEAEHVVLQRYALAVLYYSVQAASNTEQGNSGRFLQQSEELANREEFDKSWLSAESVCEWHGIVCDEDNESVTEINLPSHSLQGTIPRELFVPSAMPYLKSLDLKYNNLQGSFPEVDRGRKNVGSQLDVKPPDSALEVLAIEKNQLTGSLDSLMALTNLRMIRVEENKFTGTIPDTIEHLSSLSSLHLNNNRLSGTLPGLILGGLTKLSILKLQSNQFSGAIPEDFHINLQEAVLSDNKFAGTIPQRLGDLEKLRQLFLDGNGLTGKIPDHFGHLALLEQLRLEGNDITGTMPSVVCDLRGKKLSVLESDCSKKISCDCCTHCW